MNISNWGIGRIMQLPDWCFGRRFLVSVCVRLSGGGLDWDISEVGLGDRAMLWNVMIKLGGSYEPADYIRLVLGDQLPTAAAMVDALEPLLPGLGIQGAEPRRIYLGRPATDIIFPLRQVIDAQGRRPIMEFASAAMDAALVIVALTVSSIPTEVPDWLVSV